MHGRTHRASEEIQTPTNTKGHATHGSRAQGLMAPQTTERKSRQEPRKARLQSSQATRPLGLTPDSSAGQLSVGVSDRTQRAGDLNTEKVGVGTALQGPPSPTCPGGDSLPALGSHSPTSRTLQTFREPLPCQGGCPGPLTHGSGHSTPHLPTGVPRHLPKVSPLYLLASEKGPPASPSSRSLILTLK